MSRLGRPVVGVALLTLVAASILAAPRVVSAQTGVEHIDSYEVSIDIEDSGSILVEETIAYDFGAADRHGILRDIPVRLRYDDVRPGYDRVYPLDVVSVSASPGTPAGFTTESVSDNLRLRIGDPDRTISGRHTYEIAYRVDEVLNGFSHHDELLWNAVGAGWQVPIEEAVVEISAPAAFTETLCFAGPELSTAPCAGSTIDGNVAAFAHGRLEPLEAFTVVAALPPGSVPVPEPVLDERWSLARAFSLTPVTVVGSSVLLVAAVAGFAAVAWRTGRDRRWVGSETDAAFGNVGGDEEHVSLFEHHRPPVEFVPPDGIRPGQMGILVDEVAHPIDVTATIIDLAVRGYLRIDEHPTDGRRGKPDWELVRIKDPYGLAPYEAALFKSLFDNESSVRISDLRNHFASSLRKVQDALYRDVVDQGWFRTRPDHVRQRWLGIGVAVAVAGLAVVIAAAAWTDLALLALPFFLGGILLVVGARWMPRRTAKGTAAVRRALGFRRLIEESEAERARFAERQHLFSEYLPYAVVFGCTDKWARAFAGLDGEMPATGWYHSPYPFTALAFSQSIDGFSVTTAGTLTATPAGSGSSGFSGGGFSGGGAGGGGGGSW